MDLVANYRLFDLELTVGNIYDDIKEHQQNMKDKRKYFTVMKKDLLNDYYLPLSIETLMVIVQKWTFGKIDGGIGTSNLHHLNRL